MGVRDSRESREPMRQRTLKQSIDVIGVGLHTGRRIRMQIQPGAAGSGIRFVRTDRGDAWLHLDPLSPGAAEGRDPHAARISRADHATTLSGDGFSISTVEHLMAALRGLGIDNAVIRLSGDEVPIMDGSAAPFVYLLKEAGIRPLQAPRRVITLKRPVSVVDGDREVTVYPADRFRVTYTIDFSHPAIGRQTFARTVGRRIFVDELASARTFCLLKDVQLLRKRGLALGGSLANAVVVGDAGPLNRLRFADEFVRHKTLDLIGDLALLGHPLLGHVVAFKAGHEMHSRLLRQLIAERDAWTLAEAPRAVGERRPAAVAEAAVASY